METFTSSSRPMRSVARGPLISERNHTTPLFHASVAATHLHTHAHTHSNKCKHAQTDAYKTKKTSFESLGGQEVRHSSVLTVSMRQKRLWLEWRPYRETDMSGLIFKNHHSVVLFVLHFKKHWLCCQSLTCSLDAKLRQKFLVTWLLNMFIRPGPQWKLHSSNLGPGLNQS